MGQVKRHLHLPSSGFWCFCYVKKYIHVFKQTKKKDNDFRLGCPLLEHLPWWKPTAGSWGSLMEWVSVEVDLWPQWSLELTPARIAASQEILSPKYPAWNWVKEISFKMESGSQSGGSHAVPLDVNYRSQQEETYLAFPAGSYLYFTTPTGGRKFSSCAVTAQTMRMATTQPTRNHHSPELLLSSNGLSFKATLSKFLPFSKKNIPVLCWTRL